VAPMINRYFKQLKIILLCFDIASFILAFLLTNHMKPIWDPETRVEYFVIAVISIAVILYVFNNLGLYKIESNFIRESLIVIKGTVISFFVIFGLSFFYRSTHFFTISRLFFGYLVIIFLILTLINRWFFRKLMKSFGRIKPIQRNTLVVGCGEVGRTLIDALLMRPSVWRLAGFVDDNDNTKVYRAIPFLGSLRQLSEIIVQEDIADVFICMQSASREKIRSFIQKCDSLNVNWRVVPNLYGLPMDGVHFDRLHTVPLVGPKITNIVGINLLIKRTFDFVLSSLMIALTAPLMVAIAIAIKLTSPGPVLFRQERVGMNGKHFTLLKFRSMYINADDKVHRDYATQWIKSNACHSTDTKGKALFKIARDPRITPVGYWLRKLSLDELPQLFNIWKGDMSLVGPRPPMPYEVEIYEDWQKKRLQAPPGLTGLWQVSGRNKISFEEMVRLDICYINNWSIEEDLKIILKTVAIVAFSKGH
jgi:exopolysaccharide biosynthesis polyprenyl glycosylphosphotransferase